MGGIGDFFNDLIFGKKKKETIEKTRYPGLANDLEEQLRSDLLDQDAGPAGDALRGERATALKAVDQQFADAGGQVGRTILKRGLQGSGIEARTQAELGQARAQTVAEIMSRFGTAFGDLVEQRRARAIQQTLAAVTGVEAPLQVKYRTGGLLEAAGAVKEIFGAFSAIGGMF